MPTHIVYFCLSKQATRPSPLLDWEMANCVCVCLSLCQYDNSTELQYISNVFIREFVRLIDIARGQIDEILIKFRWKLDEKFVCLALPGRVN